MLFPAGHDGRSYYQIVQSPRGYAIFFQNVILGRPFYISDGLTLKQAKKWCERLNEAYNQGFADGNY